MKLLRNILTAVIFIIASAHWAAAVEVLTGKEAAKVIEVENVNISPEKVSGVLANKSPHIVRDVELLIQNHWLWADEYNPGTDSPGRAEYVRLNQTIEPGKRVPFSYKPSPPLPTRTDGRFVTEVDLASFTVVIPQDKAATSGSGMLRR
jgi:hypothetical protein